MIALFVTAMLSAVKPGVPCRSSLAVSEKGYACVEYAEGNGVVVYALEQSPPIDYDFKHQVFVALVGRSVVDRVDFTKRMLDMGEHDGTFMEMSAAVRPFELAGRAVVDIELSSTLSGTGAITVASDLIVEVNETHLREVAVLEGTFSWARGGWGYVAETDSEIFAGDRELLWIRRSSKGTTKRWDDPLVVHCKVESRLYRYASGKLEYAGSVSTSLAREKKMKLLNPRKSRPYLPCCAGCKFREIH
jgi:hypothetical protein